jgi:chromosomal replication initiator protein
LKGVTIETIKLAEEGKFLAEPKKTEFLVEHICNVVCKYFNIKQEIFQSKTQKREIVFARQIAFYFARKYTKLSLAKIGEKVGGKDHATVRHGIITVENLMETNKKYFKTVKEIRDKIKIIG